MSRRTDEEQQLPPEGQMVEEQGQGAAMSPAGMSGRPAVNPPLVIDADDVQNVILLQDNPPVFGQLDKKGNLIGEPQTARRIVIEDGTVELDLRAGRNGPQGGPQQPIEIATEGAGGIFTSGSKAVITNYSGQPPIKVGEKSNVTLQVNPAEFMGFSASRGADGKPVVQSNITLERGNNGEVLVKRGNEVMVTVPKDGKVDITDDKGNKIITIDGNKDLDAQREELVKAEKEAGKAFIKNSPDRSMREATFRSASEPAPSAPAASGPQQGILGHPGTAVTGLLEAGRHAITTQATGGLNQVVAQAVPRITNPGGGRLV